MKPNFGWSLLFCALNGFLAGLNLSFVAHSASDRDWGHFAFGSFVVLFSSFACVLNGFIAAGLYYEAKK